MTTVTDRTTGTKPFRDSCGCVRHRSDRNVAGSPCVSRLSWTVNDDDDSKSTININKLGDANASKQLNSLPPGGKAFWVR